MYLIRNLADGPRDYPLSNGESVYLEPRGSVNVAESLISDAIRVAAKKSLIEVEQKDKGKETDVWE